MWKTVVRRLLIMIPQILLLSILVFVVAEFMPGDALTGLIDPNIDPARLEELREQMGLNEPATCSLLRLDYECFKRGLRAKLHV